MKILHLEDSHLDHVLVQKALANAGLACHCQQVETLEEFCHRCRTETYDAVLADYQLPGFTAVDAWHAFPQAMSKPPFVLFSGAIGESAAVSAIQLGFADYLSKAEGTRLAHVVSRAIEFNKNTLAKAEADLALAQSQRRLSELNEHLNTIIENERKAICREVHDDIGSALAAAKFDIAWILRRSVESELREHAQAAQASLQAAIDASRRIMLNLRPPILDDGLRAAIEWLADAFSKRSGIPVRLQIDNDAQTTSPALLLVSFRVAQEALTNISKHAACTLVTIEISGREDFLTLEVTDNGKGMLREEQGKPHSFGLLGLQERALSVGGWLDVSSQPGIGTSIILSAPLHGATKTNNEVPM